VFRNAKLLLAFLDIANTNIGYSVFMRLYNHTNGVSTTRRQILVASGTALLTSLAGCSAVRDFTSNVALNEVNVFNMAGQQIQGSIEVVNPTGNTTLEKMFNLDHEQDQNYGDVLSASGEYEVSVELTNTEIESISQTSNTGSIDDVDEEKIGVVFNTNEEYEPIEISVGTTPKDFLKIIN
jgi:hypothetical protein